MNIELNDDEAKVLVNLLNVAVKARGLEAAESALHFVGKIQTAATAEANAQAAPAPVLPTIDPILS